MAAADRDCPQRGRAIDPVKLVARDGDRRARELDTASTTPLALPPAKTFPRNDYFATTAVIGFLSQPVLNAKALEHLEVRDVARNDRRVVHRSDGGDLTVEKRRRST
jgi:hypothetical protein